MQDNSSHTSATLERGNSISAGDMSKLSNSDNLQNNPKKTFSFQPSKWIPGKSRQGSEILQNPVDQQSKDMQTQVGKGLAGERYVLSIMTADDGYNSGRKYYFQANSDAERREIIDILAARSKAARLSKEAKGKIERIREIVGDVIKSNPFQYFFAFLIAMVRL